MARREITVVTDDYTGNTIREEDARQVFFAIGVEGYALETTEETEAAIRAALAPFMAKATKVKANQGQGKGKGARTQAAPSAHGLTKAERDGVRAHARSRGKDVRDRGRMSGEDIDAWREAGSPTAEAVEAAQRATEAPKGRKRAARTPAALFSE
jgi:hypothetical protein